MRLVGFFHPRLLYEELHVVAEVREQTVIGAVTVGLNENATPVLLADSEGFGETKSGRLRSIAVRIPDRIGEQVFCDDSEFRRNHLIDEGPGDAHTRTMLLNRKSVNRAHS